MNRKNAIFSIFFLGGGFIATYSGMKWYQLYKTPDLAFLTAHKDLIAALAEIMIPRTDSPGARDVMAHEIMITLLTNVSDRKTQNKFIEGLKEVERYSMNTYKVNFTSLAENQQRDVVSHFYETGKNYAGILGKAKNKLLGKSFFDILKYYTTIAFCTSEPGATKALVYDYIPGKYLACMNLSVNQRSWATK
jgi:hypothetical protein